MTKITKIDEKVTKSNTKTPIENVKTVRKMSRSDKKNY